MSENKTNCEVIEKFDPDAVLNEQLELAHKLLATHHGDPTARLAHLVIVLDVWLRPVEGGKDGELPKRWQTPESEQPKWLRQALIELRDECLGSKQPGYRDPDGAVLLSHTIRWPHFKIEGKPYEPLTD